MELERDGRPVVLVAEPRALPGMWLGDVLTDAGCAVSGPSGTCAEAAGSLDERPPDGAVVSVDLDRTLVSRSPAPCPGAAFPSP